MKLLIVQCYHNAAWRRNKSTKPSLPCTDRMFWMKRDVANDIGNKGLSFVETYDRLARYAFDNSKALWALMPKGHVVHHIFSDLFEAADEWVINPLVFAVQISEDFVGKKIASSPSSSCDASHQTGFGAIVGIILPTLDGCRILSGMRRRKERKSARCDVDMRI